MKSFEKFLLINKNFHNKNLRTIKCEEHRLNSDKNRKKYIQINTIYLLKLFCSEFN